MGDGYYSRGAAKRPAHARHRAGSGGEGRRTPSSYHGDHPPIPRQALAEREAADEGRRREIARLHEEAAAGKAREEELKSRAAVEARALEAELLKLRRELSAAKRVEANATAAAAFESSDSHAGTDSAAAAAGAAAAPEPPPLPVLDTDKRVSVEAVKQQSQQLAWRCQELRELDEKIAAARAAAEARASKRQRHS